MPTGVKLVGRIAAGQPIEAIEQHEELTFTDWMEPGDKFALRVSGDSMIEEHIADGDFVIIQQQEQARDGQIVAVRDDDGEATLKKILQGQEPDPPRAGQQDHEADLPRPRQRSGRAGRRGPEILRTEPSLTVMAIDPIMRRSTAAGRAARPVARLDRFEGSISMESDASAARRSCQALHRRRLQRQSRARGLGVHPPAPRDGPDPRRLGAEPDTTNNRMELTGVIEGLASLKRPCRVELVTDSQYVAKGIREWLPNWKRQGWQRKEGGRFKPVMNARPLEAARRAPGQPRGTASPTFWAIAATPRTKPATAWRSA